MGKKKVYYMLGSILAMSMLCQGCQKNPKEDYVVNKNEGALEEGIKEKKKNIYETPATYEDYFTNDAGDIRIEVNAGVKEAEGALPVVKVEPHEITVEEVKRWTEVLFEGKKAYEPKRELSKREIEKKILEYKKLAGDHEALLKEYGSEEDVQAMVDFYEEEIRNYEKMYQKAPEEVEQILCDWKFKPYDYYMEDAGLWEGNEEFESLKKTKELRALTEELHGQTACVSAVNRNEKDYYMHSLGFYYTEEAFLRELPDKKISMEEAIAIAEDLIRQLGIGDWTLQEKAHEFTETDSIQKLTYSPEYQNVPLFAWDEMEIDLKSEDLYAANYYYTRLEIDIRNGVVESVMLTSPLDTIKVENENVNTLPFEEVYQKFKNHVQTKYTKSSFFEGEVPNEDMAMELQIYKIEQGLFRIKEKGTDGEFLIVPAWRFQGKVKIDGELWNEQVFGVINAIDGSTIDVALGY